MSIKFWNTLTRSLQEFVPIEPDRVRMYTCGPTIYNYAHIGNFRAYVFEDLLRRYLEYRGYQVYHVMNLTDVEDKLIRLCRETGRPLKEITGFYAQAFFEDIKTLDILPAHIYPAATDHIPEMVEMIKILREKGHTYEHEGSVYFKISTFAEYGKLAHIDPEGLKAGASGRVDTDEYETEEARDFALWKAWTPEDGEVFWDTELGRGRPGWHIECSAMSTKYLGPHFDIHCGGVDNIFPHHENEIAQSVCCTGQPFVNYWLHCAHLMVDGRKMSKSLGNFFTLRDLLQKGMDPRAIRWVLAATHYRQPNNFTFEAVDAAAQALKRVQDFRVRLAECARSGNGGEEECLRCRSEFETAMDDDLNISAALGAVFNFIRDMNRLLDDGKIGSDGATRAQALLDDLHRATGLFPPLASEEVPAEVMEQVHLRQEARRRRDFAEADRIRDALLSAGWLIEDTPKGPRVRRAGGTPVG
ncbi:MAG TPA: cysteine--tRNA ligase [Candidatus Hydrogenedentes bacterium]|nr:cysteine--tRNA ligase [Candidatus Hydrogenedentota bacterium]